MNDGWFVTAHARPQSKESARVSLPGAKQFWWIEYAGIDAIRMDTYPYADYDAASNWMKELNDEYPNYNVVGETWVTELAYTAWWQRFQVVRSAQQQPQDRYGLQLLRKK